MIQFVIQWLIPAIQANESVCSKQGLEHILQSIGKAKYIFDKLIKYIAVKISIWNK